MTSSSTKTGNSRGELRERDGEFSREEKKNKIIFPPERAEKKGKAVWWSSGDSVDLEMQGENVTVHVTSLVNVCFVVEKITDSSLSLYQKIVLALASFVSQAHLLTLIIHHLISIFNQRAKTLFIKVIIKHVWVDTGLVPI